MQENTLERSKNASQFTNSSLWRTLRWTPVTVMLLAVACLLVMVFLGGMTRIRAWYLLRAVPPLLALISLIVVVLYAIIRWRLSKPIVITVLVSLLSLSPAVLMVVPVAYPASIASTTPSATVRLPADGPPEYFGEGTG